MSIFASRSRRSRFRSQGDAERDRRNWIGAAENYRRHLLVREDDVPIWVQLGHALKESGLTHQAIAAYREAVRLSPEDGDGLISLGFLYKAEGDRDRMVESFRRAYAATGSYQAEQELRALGLSVKQKSAAERAGEFSALRSAVEPHANGLKLLTASDVDVLTDGSLELTSDDPWLVFDFEDFGDDAPVGLLTVRIAEVEGGRASDEESTPDTRLIAQIYADRGIGFDEQQSLRFEFDSGVARLLIVNPGEVRKLRLDPSCAVCRVRFEGLRFEPIVDAGALTDLVRNAARNDPRVETILPPLLERFEQQADENRYTVGIPSLITLREGAGLEFSLEMSHDYDFWLLQNDNHRDADFEQLRTLGENLPSRPFFSFVMPVYNTPPKLLRECIDAMLGQTYQNFEICVADDNSSDPEIAKILTCYAAQHDNFKFVERRFNGHISAASNSALALASGDFVVLVDHDDLIPPYALHVVADYVGKHPHADVFYSDEDKILLSGRRLQPYFKSDFNKYLLYGHNMISHLGVYRRSLVNAIGGFRLGLEGSQDYDLFLRCYEQSSDDRIVHIPHILYHWRVMPGSTAMSADQKSYAQVAAQVAINGHFERTGMPLRSVDGFAPGCSGVKPSKTFDTPLSIVIPTRNGIDVLEPCIDSILARPHDNTEILVIDNGSDDVEALEYFAKLEEMKVARILRFPDPFNFSLINNFAVEHATGDLVCFLNNDTEVLGRDWLNRARAFLSMDEIGAVGARLLFPDGALQHFGIALGMGSHRVAGTPHGGMSGEIPGYFGKARLLQEVSAATAACLFVRREDFIAVGGFEPELRVAYNDVDLCLKLRERGLRILVDPDICLTHKESRSRGSDKRGERARRLQEEANWMRARWAGHLDADPYFSPNLDLDRLDFGYAMQPRVAWPWADTAHSARSVATALA